MMVRSRETGGELGSRRVGQRRPSLRARTRRKKRTTPRWMPMMVPPAAAAATRSRRRNRIRSSLYQEGSSLFVSMLATALLASSCLMVGPSSAFFLLVTTTTSSSSSRSFVSLTKNPALPRFPRWGSAATTTTATVMDSTGTARIQRELRPPAQNRRSASDSSSSSTRLFQAQVSTQFLLLENNRGDDDDDDDKSLNKKNRLSRPERKALERAKKQKNKQTANSSKNKNNNNNNNSNSKKQRRQHDDASGSSGALPVLTPENTVDDVLRRIKRAQNRHDARDLRAVARFLLRETSPDFFADSNNNRGSLLARLAVAALHLREHGVAADAMEERNRHHAASKVPMEDAALVRGLLRVHNVTEAWEVLNRDLALPAESPDDWTDERKRDAAARDRVRHRALALASIVSRHLFEGEPVRGCAACRVLAETGAHVRAMGGAVGESAGSSNSNNSGDDDAWHVPWTRLLRGAAQCQNRVRSGTLPRTWENSQLAAGKAELPCNVVYAVLDAMAAFPTTNSDRVYELLATALVRRVVFVTGAVDLRSCPPADRGEACFIGRSNVGKSSLINMITNRKALAYTSKRPGKTQQFNFFAVNDAPDKEKEVRYGDVVTGRPDPDSFYIVDLPGFGYAAVPEAQRRAWLEFMREYLETRRTVRTVFHLIDSRHGATAEDETIMQQVAGILNDPDSKASFQYVVVLTKADKNVKGGSNGNSKRLGKVSESVMELVRTTMRRAGVKNNVPVLLSSAETKLGRDDLWRYLRRAAEA